MGDWIKKKLFLTGLFLIFSIGALYPFGLKFYSFVSSDNIGEESFKYDTNKDVFFLDSFEIEDSGRMDATSSIEDVRDSLAISDTTSAVDFFISFERDSLKKSWHNYVVWISRLPTPESSSSEIASKNNELKDCIEDGTELILTENKPVETGLFKEKSTKLVEYPIDVNNVDRQLNSKNVELPLPFVQKFNSSLHSFYFVVQVGACKQPLDSIDIRKKYDGPFKVWYRFEEGWHKYQIGMTDNYFEALETLNSFSLKDRFLVAYNEQGEKMQLWKAVLNQIKKLISFRVQIAASTTALTKSNLTKIYDGDFDVIEVEEDGWYKYQIEVGNNYKSAREKEEIIDVEGAFLVPYFKGEKMQLQSLLRFYRF
jgi:hypothetical protein